MDPEEGVWDGSSPVLSSHDPAMPLRLSALMLAASTALAGAQQAPPDMATLLGMGYDYQNCSAFYAMLKTCVGPYDAAKRDDFDHKEDIARLRATVVLSAAGKTRGEILTMGVHIAEDMRDEVHNDCAQASPALHRYFGQCEKLIAKLPGE